MSYCCELTQKTSQNGNNVSHSCKKTKRLFRPNLQKIGFFSEILGKKISFKVAASVVKTIGQCGGLDGFLLKQKDNKLSLNALKTKQLIIKHLAAVQKSD